MIFDKNKIRICYITAVCILYIYVQTNKKTNYNEKIKQQDCRKVVNNYEFSPTSIITITLNASVNENNYIKKINY